MIKVAWVAFATPNYQVMTDQWLRTLQDCGVDSKDVILGQDTIPQDLARGGFDVGSLAWFWCLTRKVQYLRNVLASADGSYDLYVCSDCDIQFFPNNNEWDTLFHMIYTSDKWMWFMREGTAEMINGGFYIVHSAHVGKVVTLLDDVLKELADKPNVGLGDQTVFNAKLHEISFDYIPLHNVVWGWNVPQDASRCIFHHATCCNTISSKQYQMNIVRQQVTHRH